MKKVSKHFRIEEMVDPMYMEMERAGRILAAWYVSRFQVNAAEFLRKRFGVTYINTYLWDEDPRTESGTRRPDTKTGAEFSQHKYMNAIDPIFQDVSAAEVRDDALENQELYLEHGITTIESGEYAPTWFHCDGRIWSDRKVHVIEP
jgi:hypothetical protein